MLTEHRSRDRRYRDDWRSEGVRRDQVCDAPWGHAPRRRLPSGGESSGSFEQREEKSSQPAMAESWLAATADLERLQNELNEIVAQPWPIPRREQFRAPAADEAEECEPVSLSTVASYASKDRIWALVEEVTSDEIVAVALSPSGREVIRLPLGLFSVPPSRGTRVEIALPARSEHEAPIRELAPENKSPAASALDRAYEALDALLAQRHASGPDPELEQRLEVAWAHLDELQEAVCAEVRQEINASFALPPDELERMLVEVRAQLAKDDE
jgi:hypothetical protein